MKKNKKTSFCSTELSSDCVDYIGEDLKSLDKDFKQCDLTITDVVEQFDKEIKKVKDSLDTKKLTKLCISTIDKEDNVIIIINKLIKEICLLSTELENFKSNSIEFDILSLIVNIDSDCLSSSHCSTDGSLKSLLIKMISEICLLKSQVNNSSSSSIYVP